MCNMNLQLHILYLKFPFGTITCSDKHRRFININGSRHNVKDERLNIPLEKIHLEASPFPLKDCRFKAPCLTRMVFLYLALCSTWYDTGTCFRYPIRTSNKGYWINGFLKTKLFPRDLINELSCLTSLLRTVHVSLWVKNPRVGRLTQINK